MYVSPGVFAVFLFGSVLGACGLWWALVVALGRLYRGKAK